MRGRQRKGEGGEEEQSGSEGGEGLEEAARLWAGPGRPPPGTGQTEGWGCGALRGHRLCESVRVRTCERVWVTERVP